jgi:phosphoglycolate phosphatase-like HAD superfamily hydrolase
MLALFDVDGTLLRRLYPAEGGVRTSRKEKAFMRALDRIWHVKDAFYTVVLGENLQGMTDLAIMMKVVESLGVDALDFRERVEEVKKAVIEEFEKLGPEYASSREYEVLSGVEDMLAALEARGVKLGLATGNLEYFANYKLRLLGLLEYFTAGGFGDTSFNRADIVKQVLSETGEKEAFLFGDTPSDIEAGHFCKIGVIAVASGKHSLEQLAACSPDLLVSSMVEKEKILSYLGY